MTPEPVEDLSAALEAVGEMVAAVRQDQWALPTPCPDWNVRELVNHLVIGNLLFAGILRGEAAVSPVALDPRRHDALGGDPVGAYRGAARELAAAFAGPGILAGTFTVPAGTVPGIVAAQLRITEALVHGHDLAQATGQPPPRVPGAIIRRNLEFTRAKLADLPPGRSPFAAPRPVPGDAPPIVRLAALLGRRPVQDRQG